MTHVNARPIILRAWEVRGILGGSVTQIWRAMKRQPESPGCLMNTPAGELWYVWPHEQEPGVWVEHFCAFPWGKVGSRIWGRETWRVEARQLHRDRLTYMLDYAADPGFPTLTPTDRPDAARFADGKSRWRSSATMPLWGFAHPARD